MGGAGGAGVETREVEFICFPHSETPRCLPLSELAAQFALEEHRRKTGYARVMPREVKCWMA